MTYRVILSRVVLISLAGTLGCAQDGEPVSAEQLVESAAPVVSDLYAGSPDLGELRNTVVYGEIWERPQLSKRDRSLITVAVLQALVRDELEIHIPRGLDNGLTPEEISEIILHVTFDAGWPTGVQASLIAAQVFDELRQGRSLVGRRRTALDGCRPVREQGPAQSQGNNRRQDTTTPSLSASKPRHHLSPAIGPKLARNLRMPKDSPSTYSSMGRSDGSISAARTSLATCRRALSGRNGWMF